MFADEYPRFIEASELTPDLTPEDERQRNRSALEQRNRMNERYEGIFASNRDIFDGARVLDLASHDGRFSMAAMKAGAAHVTGVEVRQSLVDKAQENFAFYGQDPETYRFVCGDVFEVLEQEKFDVDVVLCLGYFYHTYRHTELMYRLHHLAPKHLIIDTMVTPDTNPTLKLVREPDAADIRSAAQDAWSVDRVLVLRPSVPALELLVRSYGFEVQSLHDWKSQLSGRLPMPGLDGYATGKRVTMRCISREEARATGWKPQASAPGARGVRPGRGGRDQAPPPPAEQSDGWRGRVNRTLTKATGYELRRAPTKR